MLLIWQRVLWMNKKKGKKKEKKDSYSEVSGKGLCLGCNFYVQWRFLHLPPCKVPLILATPRPPPWCPLQLSSLALRACAGGNGHSLLSLQQEIPCVLHIRKLLRCVRGWLRPGPVGVCTLALTPSLRTPASVGTQPLGPRAGRGGVVNISAWYSTTSAHQHLYWSHPSRDYSCRAHSI